MLTMAFSTFVPHPPSVTYHPDPFRPKLPSSLMTLVQNRSTLTHQVVSRTKSRKIVARASDVGGDYKDDHYYVPCEDTEETSAGLVTREGLKPELMPKHVALLIDGHRRWAKERDLPVEAGHLSCQKPLEQVIRLCCDLEIKVLSVYIFSTENWLRPDEEVVFLLKIMEAAMKFVMEKFMRDDIRISVIGNKERFPKSLQETIALAEKITKDNKKLHVLAAMQYNGRSDVTQACKTLAKKVKNGEIQAEEIDENLIQEQLQTNCSEYPNPDLFIRTSGIMRLGNFMLWQMAYSELFFEDKYHPDFTEADFIRVLRDFQKRRRRFGG